jgi:hypothetical protein
MYSAIRSLQIVLKNRSQRSTFGTFLPEQAFHLRASSGVDDGTANTLFGWDDTPRVSRPAKNAGFIIYGDVAARLHLQEIISFFSERGPFRTII